MAVGRPTRARSSGTSSSPAPPGCRPTSFGGRNLVAELGRDIRRERVGLRPDELTSFAVLALRAASVAPAAGQLAWLVRQEDADGGFNFATRGRVERRRRHRRGARGARRRAGGPRPRGPGHARSATSGPSRTATAGSPASPAPGSNAQSTAFAVQGLIAAGVDPSSLHRHGAPSPLDYLRSLIAGDGHVDYSRGTDRDADVGDGRGAAWRSRASRSRSRPVRSPERGRLRLRPTTPTPRADGRVGTIEPAHSTRPGRGPRLATPRRRGERGPRRRSTGSWLDAGILTALSLASSAAADSAPGENRYPPAPACRSESPRRRPRASAGSRSCPRWCAS